MSETGFFRYFSPVSHPSRFMNNYYSTHRKEQTMFGLKQDANITRLWELFDRCFDVVPKPLSKHAQRKHDSYIRHQKAYTARQLFALQENEISRMKLDAAIHERLECQRSVQEFYYHRTIPISSITFLFWFVLWYPVTGMM